MLSPLLYLLLKYGKWIVVVGLLLVTPYIKEFTETFNQLGIAYFALGGAIAMYSDLKTIDRVTHLNSFLCYSFFIYLFHEPVFNIIKKIGLKVLGVHEWSLILLYLINPLIMCATAIMVAKLLQRFVPKVFSVLVGGR